MSEYKFRLRFFCRLLTSLLVVLPATGHVQVLPDGWVFIAEDQEGRKYHYHSKTLARTGMPPSTISVNITAVDAVNRAGGYHRWSIDCQNGTVSSQGGAPIAIAGESSVRAQFHATFCGIRQADGYWFPVGATVDQATKKISQLILIDVQGISKAKHKNNDVIGVRAATGSMDIASRRIINLTPPGMFYVQCPNPSEIYVAPSTGQAEFPLQTTKNTYAEGFADLICRGYFPLTEVVAGSSTKAPASPSAFAEKLETAKRKCKELGFEEKTEKFGECVLKVSE